MIFFAFPPLTSEAEPLFGPPICNSFSGRRSGSLPGLASNAAPCPFFQVLFILHNLRSVSELFFRCLIRIPCILVFGTFFPLVLCLVTYCSPRRVSSRVFFLPCFGFRRTSFWQLSLSFDPPLVTIFFRQDCLFPFPISLCHPPPTREWGTTSFSSYTKRVKGSGLVVSFHP